ncbi:MAG: SurA N-terminal domain-containing protein [Alysiella sp.]|uniref:peptidylprolyl isomerase n=1 Tax=Alysiella sp. TaxID=1872483 RepID=UPI0026DC18F5|nr:SurA N-terminal domain-containing protein [Alysiella sp.]MDO4434446.1 SurA N-terminal domain-containing protein [Alysiella sp.]
MKHRILTSALLLSISFQAAAEIKPINSVAAEVNSTLITYGDIQRNIKELKSRPTNQGIPEAQLAQAAKNKLMERALLTDAARQMGMKIMPNQIDAELTRRAQDAKTNVEQLYQTAKANGYTRDTFRTEVAKDLLIEYLLTDLTDDIRISDAQINEFYATAQRNGTPLPQAQPYTVYTIRRLILNAGNKQNMPATGSRMNQILQAVQQGTAFEILVRRYSQEPQAATHDGIHDNISEGMLPATAENFLPQIQKGQILPPIASGTTWQMIQLLDSRTETDPNKTQREAIRRSLLNAERQKAQNSFIGQLQQNAIIREY